MFTLIPKSKKLRIGEDIDFYFKDFESFYSICDYITYSFKGVYRVVIDTNKVSDVMEFMENATRYDHLSIDIYMDKSLIENITLMKPNVQVSEQKSDYILFKEMISQRGLLFKKGVALKLYGSIQHDYESMAGALGLLLTTYGQFREIDETMISNHFIINSMVYPRQVVMQYLYYTRYRESTLKKCLNCMPHEAVYWSIKKNLTKLMKSKAVYLKTGKDDRGIKNVNTNNLMVMYRIFNADNENIIKDVAFLLQLYELSISTKDLLEEESLC